MENVSLTRKVVSYNDTGILELILLVHKLAAIFARRNGCSKDDVNTKDR